MVKKWMGNLMSVVCFVAAIIVFLGGSVGCGCAEGDQELGDWKKRSSTEVVSQTYQDGEGNRIIYYCCKTTYYEEQNATAAGTVDRQAVSTVLDLDRAVDGRECTVGDWPALLCRQADRTYLCWTISPEYSCVIEYDANAVAEEDIFRMAESVVQKG